MPVYSFSQATENGTTYYVTTIAPIITDNGEVVAYYQAVVQTGNPIIPTGYKRSIGARTVIGAKITL